MCVQVLVFAKGACHLQRVLFTGEGVQKISTNQGGIGREGK